MVSRSRVDRGRATNRIVANWLRAHGWPDARSTYGTEPGMDVQNVHGHAIEVKARSDFSPLTWLRQAAQYVGDGYDFPCVIVRMNGQGDKSAGDFLVIRRLKDDELNKFRVFE